MVAVDRPLAVPEVLVDHLVRERQHGAAQVIEAPTDAAEEPGRAFGLDVRRSRGGRGRSATSGGIRVVGGERREIASAVIVIAPAPAPAHWRHAVRPRKNSVNLSMASSRKLPTFPRKSANAVAVAVGLFHTDRMRNAAATSKKIRLISMLKRPPRGDPAAPQARS